MSSTSFRSDSVHFYHRTNHTSGDVEFHTSNNFDMKKPVKSEEFIVNSSYKLIVSNDTLIIQKKVGDTYQTKFSVE